MTVTNTAINERSSIEVHLYAKSERFPTESNREHSNVNYVPRTAGRHTSYLRKTNNLDLEKFRLLAPSTDINVVGKVAESMTRLLSLSRAKPANQIGRLESASSSPNLKAPLSCSLIIFPKKRRLQWSAYRIGPPVSVGRFCSSLCSASLSLLLVHLFCSFRRFFCSFLCSTSLPDLLVSLSVLLVSLFCLFLCLFCSSLFCSSLCLAIMLVSLLVSRSVLLVSLSVLVCLSFCIPACLSFLVSPSACLPVCYACISICLGLLVSLYACLSVFSPCLSVCLPVCLSALLVYLPACLLCLSLCLPTYFSVCSACISLCLSGLLDSLPACLFLLVRLTHCMSVFSVVLR